MLYKFDILFKKSLADGGTKVVTYSTLLENLNAFGEGESLEGVIGELSLVKEGAKKGFSLNSLLRKYHSLLVGRLNSETWGKEFPLQFSISNPEDAGSIIAELKDESGFLYSSQVETKTIHGEDVMNLAGQDTFVLIIAKENPVDLIDEIGVTVRLIQGEVAFVMASTAQIIVFSNNACIKLISSPMHN